MQTRLVAVLLTVLAVATGLSKGGGHGPLGAAQGGEAPVGSDAVAAIDTSHSARIAEIAKTYIGWGKVDDEARWAPWLCRMPNPSKARLSEDGPHGQKLYYLFAKHRDSYVKREATPEGQVVVKESWTKDGKPAGLYIMTKIGCSRVSGTDMGWVYGTVLVDGTVTAAGRVESCMKCHVENPGRLFGLKE